MNTSKTLPWCIFVIRDVVGQTSTPMFVLPTVTAGLRQLAALQKDSPNPDDLVLRQIGYYDREADTIAPLDPIETFTIGLQNAQNS